MKAKMMMGVVATVALFVGMVISSFMVAGDSVLEHELRSPDGSFYARIYKSTRRRGLFSDDPVLNVSVRHARRTRIGYRVEFMMNVNVWRENLEGPTDRVIHWSDDSSRVTFFMTTLFRSLQLLYS